MVGCGGPFFGESRRGDQHLRTSYDISTPFNYKRVQHSNIKCRTRKRCRGATLKVKSNLFHLATGRGYYSCIWRSPSLTC